MPVPRRHFLLDPREELLRLTSTIVGAHVANNPIAASELPSVIVTVHQALATLGPEEPAPKPSALRLRVVPVLPWQPALAVSPST